MEIIVVVDRIEGDLAVLQVGDRAVDWPVSALPEGIEEGARLSFTLSTLADDRSEAEARLERLRSKSSDDDIIDL